MAPDDHGDGGLGWVGGEVSPHPLLYTTGPCRRRTSDNTGQVVQRPSGSSRTCGVQARLPASWAGFGQCDLVFPIDGAINGSGRVSSASVGTTAPRYVATGGLAHEDQSRDKSNNKAKNAIEESITPSREAQKGCVGLVPGYERPDR